MDELSDKIFKCSQENLETMDMPTMNPETSINENVDPVGQPKDEFHQMLKRVNFNLLQIF